MQATRGAPLAGARHRSTRPLWLLAAVAAVVIAADQISKALVVAKLTPGDPIDVIGTVLRLDLTRNSGAAFSLGTGATVLFTVVAVAVVAVILRTARRLSSRRWAVSLGLLLGGAVGNLADRLFRAPGPGQGHVVDWIELPHWPVFNVADSAITVGAVVAVLLSLAGVALSTHAARHGSEQPGAVGGRGEGSMGPEELPAPERDRT